jgi:hypothetical protein
MPTAASHGRQTRHVVSPLIGIERVEQPAVKHRLEHSAQAVQVEGIGNNELSVYAAMRGLVPRDRQCGLCHVNSQNVQPQRGNVKGVLACPASCIENCAGERAFARQAQDRGLWFSSVPRRRAIEIRRIPGPARPPLVTGWLPPPVRIVGSDSCLLGHLRLFPATGVASLIVACSRSCGVPMPFRQVRVSRAPRPGHARRRAQVGRPRQPPVSMRRVIGASAVRGDTGDQTDQESRSAGHGAAPSMTGMDIPVHASFLPSDDPDARQS